MGSKSASGSNYQVKLALYGASVPNGSTFINVGQNVTEELQNYLNQGLTMLRVGNGPWPKSDGNTPLTSKSPYIPYPAFPDPVPNKTKAFTAIVFANGQERYFVCPEYQTIDFSVAPRDTGGLAIGKPYRGGIITYILKPGDQGYDPDTPHGLIAAVNDIGPPEGVRWNDAPGNVRIINSDGAAYGTGAVNTAVITSSFSQQTDYAARLASLYTDGQYHDWSLPALQELEALRKSRDILPGIDKDGTYWSSTENSVTVYTPYGEERPNAWCVLFGTGETNGPSKNTLLRVRPVRWF